MYLNPMNRKLIFPCVYLLKMILRILMNMNVACICCMYIFHWYCRTDPLFPQRISYHTQHNNNKIRRTNMRMYLRGEKEILRRLPHMLLYWEMQLWNDGYENLLFKDMHERKEKYRYGSNDRSRSFYYSTCNVLQKEMQVLNKTEVVLRRNSFIIWMTSGYGLVLGVRMRNDIKKADSFLEYFLLLQCASQIDLQKNIGKTFPGKFTTASLCVLEAIVLHLDVM